MGVKPRNFPIWPRRGEPSLGDKSLFGMDSCRAIRNNRDMHVKQILWCALSAVPLLFAGCGAGDRSESVESWPSRPITISCFAAAGGGTDLISRLVAKEMGAELGTKINVVNRTGGGGAAAINHVHNAPRDGYNWGGISDSLLTKSVLGTTTTTAKDWSCFIVAGAPGVLSVAANSPYQSLGEVIAKLKAEPKSLKAGASLVGCVWHTKLLALERAADVQFQFLPFAGSSPSQLAALSGELDVVLTSISEQADLIRSGRLRPLAMVEMESYEFPKGTVIPAAGETFPRLAEVPVHQFLGVCLPSDTPAGILDKVTAAFDKVMTTPAMKEHIETQHLTLIGESGDEAAERNRVSESVWTWALQDLGIAVKSPEEFGIPKPPAPGA